MTKKLMKAYSYLVFLGGLLKSPFLLLCRLYWGWAFFEAGSEKLHDISVFADFLNSMHFPLPLLQAYLAACIECFGGIFLLLGLASRLVAIPLIIVMLTAYGMVHTDALKAIFANPSLFVAAPPFNFLMAALLILTFGPGRFSIDYLLEKWYFQTA